MQDLIAFFYALTDETIPKESSAGYVNLKATYKYQKVCHPA